MGSSMDEPALCSQLEKMLFDRHAHVAKAAWEALYMDLFHTCWHGAVKGLGQVSPSADDIAQELLMDADAYYLCWNDHERRSTRLWFWTRAFERGRNQARRERRQRGLRSTAAHKVPGPSATAGPDWAALFSELEPVLLESVLTCSQAEAEALVHHTAARLRPTAFVGKTPDRLRAAKRAALRRVTQSACARLGLEDPGPPYQDLWDFLFVLLSQAVEAAAQQMRVREGLEPRPETVPNLTEHTLHIIRMDRSS